MVHYMSGSKHVNQDVAFIAPISAYFILSSLQKSPATQEGLPAPPYGEAVRLGDG